MTLHALRTVTPDLPGPDGAVADGPSPMEASATVVELPMPPSTNRLWKHVGGERKESAAYRDWKGHAGWRVRLQKPAPVRGRVVILMSCERVSATADIDNRVKAIFDLLVAEGVMDDDRNVVGFCIAWAPPASGLARVMILPVAEYDFTFKPSPDGASGGFFPAPQPET